MQTQYVSRNGFRKRQILASANTTAADVVVCPAATAKMAMVLSTALTSGGETSVFVTKPIPTYMPKAGNIYFTRTSGTVSTIAYTSYTGSTFTIGSTVFNSTDPNGPAAAGNAILIGIPNRVVITAWSVSCVNTGTASSFTLRNKTTTASILKVWHALATTGNFNVAQDDLTMAGESGETIQIVPSAQNTGNFDITVEGYFLPASVPLLNEYTGVP